MCYGSSIKKLSVLSFAFALGAPPFYFEFENERDDIMKKNSQGYVLVIVMIIFAILAIVGTTIMSVALFESKLASRQEYTRQAYYTARAGADAMASYIIRNPGQVTSLIADTASAPGEGSFGVNTFEVKVETGSAANQVLIRSTGIVEGTSPANVNLVLSLITNPAFDYSVFANNDFDIGNNIIVTGDVGTNSSSISFGSEDIQGNVVLGPDATAAELLLAENNSTGTATKLASKIIFPNTDPNLFPTEYDSATNLDNIFTDGEKLYRNTATLDIFDDIQWDATHVEGEKAELHLYMTTAATLPRIINPPAGITVFLYYNGANTINRDSGNFLYNNVFIYAPKATFNITGGGNGTFVGKIIADNITLPNSNSTFYNAPEINVDDAVGGMIYERTIWSN